MKRFFKKIGRGALIGLKQIDKVGDALRLLPGGTKLVALVPIVGPAMLIALDAVDNVERTITGPGRGDEKLAAATGEVLDKLADMGIQEKRIRGIIELALLIYKGEAGLAKGE